MNNLQAINSSRILQYFCANWITKRTTWSNSWRKIVLSGGRIGKVGCNTLHTGRRR